MPPSACGVGSGAPWRPVRGGSVPPPPSPGTLIGLWYWRAGVTESGGAVSAWASVMDDGAGPYVLAPAAGSSVLVLGSDGIGLDGGGQLIGSCGTRSGPGTSGASWRRAAAGPGATDFVWMVQLAATAPLRYLAGVYQNPAPQVCGLGRDSGGSVNSYILPGPAAGEGAAVITAAPVLAWDVVAPAPAASFWSSSPPVAPWSAMDAFRIGGNGSVGLVGAVRAAAWWSDVATAAQAQERAAYLRALL